MATYALNETHKNVRIDRPLPLVSILLLVGWWRWQVGAMGSNAREDSLDRKIY